MVILLLYALILLMSYVKTSEHLRNKHICLYSNQANERGSEIALYDYANYCELYFQMKSTIIFPKYLERSTQYSEADGKRLSLQRFQSRFNVSFCGPSERNKRDLCLDLSQVAMKLHCDILYVQKAGHMKSEPIYPDSFKSNIPTAIHAIFSHHPHGTVYASISPDIANGGLVVPHMLDKPVLLHGRKSSLRTTLNISSHAKVFCRHGAVDTFNIRYVIDAVVELAQMYSTHLAFIFLGVPIHLKLYLLHTKINKPRNIIFLTTTTDTVEKERFFHSCDAMIHARSDGETFGLAVGEFSSRNKPVITQGPGFNGYSITHINILKDKGLYYYNSTSLKRIIEGILKNGILTRDWNAYRDYEPKKVMKTFKDIFLDPVLL